MEPDALVARGRSLGLASVLLGLLSTSGPLLALVPIYPAGNEVLPLVVLIAIGIVAAIAAIATGVSAISKLRGERGRGLAIIGIACGTLALLASIGVLVLAYVVKVQAPH